VEILAQSSNAFVLTHNFQGTHILGASHGRLSDSVASCYLRNCTSSKLARLLDTVSKFTLFSVSSLKDEQLIKKQTYMKTETCKLYSRVYWIFLPNFIKIDPYSLELYRVKVCAFFRHSVDIACYRMCYAVLDSRSGEDTVPNTKEHSSCSCFTSWSDRQPENPWHTGLLITRTLTAARTWSVYIRRTYNYSTPCILIGSTLPAVLVVQWLASDLWSKGR